MPADWADCTVAAQDADPASTLQVYRRTLELRRKLADLQGSELEWLASPADCLAYRRGDLSVWVNAGEVAVPLPTGELVHASAPVDGELPPDVAVWVRN
jgi:alpha-glucosidase